MKDNSQRDTDVPLSKQLTDKRKLIRLKALVIFNFSAFLNIGMLPTENEPPKSHRVLF
jgi:hypothetical protein